MTNETIRRIELAQPVKKALRQFRDNAMTRKSDFINLLKSADDQGEFNAESVWASLNRTGRISNDGVIV